MQAQPLAQLTTHIPNKGVQMVGYFGFYSNKYSGLRKKLVLDSDRGAGTNNQVPAIIKSELSTKEFRQNWDYPIEM